MCSFAVELMHLLVWCVWHGSCGGHRDGSLQLSAWLHHESPKTLTLPCTLIRPVSATGIRSKFSRTPAQTEDQPISRNPLSSIHGDWTMTRFSGYLSWYSYCWTSTTSYKPRSKKFYIWIFFSIVAYNINLILTFPDVLGGSKPSNVLLMLISLLEIWESIIQHCKSTDYDLLPAILAWLPIVVIIACFSWLNVILLEPFQNYFILIFGNGNIIYDLWRTASTDLLRILPRSPSHLTSLNLHKYSSKFQEVFKHHAE